MKKIYLIRHGVTDWNKTKKIQGHKNSNLTYLGKKQANRAGKFFENKDIDIIYTSDLNRALDTAVIINKYINRNIVKTPLIKEASFGIWEGKTLDQILKIDKSNYIKWLRTPEECTIENGENLKDLRERSYRFIELIKKDGYENILVVGHSNILKILMLTILNMDNRYFKNLSLNNTGIIKLEVRDYNTVLKYYNSTEHLKETVYE